ncbi:MAG: 1-acyl-sn-glycerol-3-phosphate acyltransferase [Holosporales bacterium]|jgi:1-acyl-sn-glycerol-3-phosphate acyltransferase|nr:1-acyl-sn-glycerol-3-phosphate acyltransferase [Holosporales bacterium]
MIRSILFNISFWTAFGLYITIMYPFTLWFFSQKRTTIIVYRNIARLMLFCLKYISDIDCKISNIDILKFQLSKGPIIIGCNHQSVWETIIFATLFDELAIIIKKELLSVPIAGLYFRKLGCIPIDRSSPISSIKSIIKYGKIASEKGQSILIFPNGTRSTINENVEYKSGIFALYHSLKIPVIPAMVDSGQCWPKRSFRKNKGTIHLDFKEAIQPGLSKDEFMHIFENKMQ